MSGPKAMLSILKSKAAFSLDVIRAQVVHPRCVCCAAPEELAFCQGHVRVHYSSRVTADGAACLSTSIIASLFRASPLQHLVLVPLAQKFKVIRVLTLLYCFHQSQALHFAFCLSVSINALSTSLPMLCMKLRKQLPPPLTTEPLGKTVLSGFSHMS